MLRSDRGHVEDVCLAVLFPATIWAHKAHKSRQKQSPAQLLCAASCVDAEAFNTIVLRRHPCYNPYSYDWDAGLPHTCATSSSRELGLRYLPPSDGSAVVPRRPISQFCLCNGICPSACSGCVRIFFYLPLLASIKGSRRRWMSSKRGRRQCLPACLLGTVVAAGERPPVAAAPLACREPLSHFSFTRT